MHNETTPSPFSAARIYERHTKLMRYKTHTQTASTTGLRERDQGKQDSAAEEEMMRKRQKLRGHLM